MGYFLCNRYNDALSAFCSYPGGKLPYPDRFSKIKGALINFGVFSRP